MSEDIDAYLSDLPDEAVNRLQQMRDMVRAQCPDAIEGINYGLIGYKLHGHPLIYFGGFKNHVGLYATPNGHEAFAEEFAHYKQGKGSVQFPLIESLPVELIERVIAYRVQAVGEELPKIGAPATRALAGIGVTAMSQLTGHTERELLELHGFGPKAIRLLHEAGAQFRAE